MSSALAVTGLSVRTCACMIVWKIIKGNWMLSSFLSGHLLYIWEYNKNGYKTVCKLFSCWVGVRWVFSWLNMGLNIKHIVEIITIIFLPFQFGALLHKKCCIVWLLLEQGVTNCSMSEETNITRSYKHLYEWKLELYERWPRASLRNISQ